jgi:WD40 repeat protein
MRGQNLILSVLRTVATVAAIAVVLGAVPARADRKADKLFEPEKPGKGAKLLAVDPKGNRLYVRLDEDSKWIEAIDSGNGKVKARYEGRGPATCACVDGGNDWLLAGDAEGRVFRWDLKTGKRTAIVRLRDRDGKGRAVSGIVPSRRGGVYVLSKGLLVEISKAVFTAGYSVKTDVRAAFRKEGHEMAFFSDRKDLVITNPGDGTYHGFKVSKAQELWVLNLGYTTTTFFDVEREDFFFEGTNSLRLIHGRKGKILEERKRVSVVCGAATEDGETFYVGLGNGRLQEYVLERRSRMTRSSGWDKFEAAITAVVLGPKEKRVYVSDSAGYLYKMRVESRRGDDRLSARGD